MAQVAHVAVALVEVVRGPGTGKRIEGFQQKGAGVVIVDDVCTTGASTGQALEAARDTATNPQVLDAFFALAPVNSLTPEVDPEGRLEIRYKPEETPVTLAAKNSYVGRRFLDWAQYPIAETETLQSPQHGWIVLFQDLRYSGVLRPFTSRPGRGGLSKAVEIDKNLHVVADIYGSGKKQIAVPEPD